MPYYTGGGGGWDEWQSGLGYGFLLYGKGGGPRINSRVKVAVREHIALGLGSCVNSRVKVAVRELIA